MHNFYAVLSNFVQTAKRKIKETFPLIFPLFPNGQQNIIPLPQSQIPCLAKTSESATMLSINKNGELTEVG
jgi:hypothetical protein